MSGQGAREETAYQAAIGRLGRHDHTKLELHEVLRAEGYAEPDIDRAMRRLERHGFLDEARLAERFTRSRVERAGLGRGRIASALEARGVPGPALERGMAEALADVSEADAVAALARRYWRARSREEPERRLQKLFALLLRRGFPAELVRERLCALWPQWKDAIATTDP